MTIPQPVLYTEDDDNDVFLMERAFEINGVLNGLNNVSDGKLAIAYLSGKGPYPNGAENYLPCLMILDLSMSGKHGFDVLQWVRTQPHLLEMPVVVLTSSNQESDIHRAYLLGASGFFIKPGDPDELIQIVEAIQEHWLEENPSRTGFLDIAAYRPSIEPKIGVD